MLRAGKELTKRRINQRVGTAEMVGRVVVGHSIKTGSREEESMLNYRKVRGEIGLLNVKFPIFYLVLLSIVL